MSKKFKCECGKSYPTKQGLAIHKGKYCLIQNAPATRQLAASAQARILAGENLVGVTDQVKMEIPNLTEIEIGLRHHLQETKTTEELMIIYKRLKSITEDFKKKLLETL